MMLDVEAVRHRFAKTAHMPASHAIGVLTAADAGYFPGVQLLSASLGQAVPLAIVDLGFSVKQRQWCQSQGRHLVSSPTLRISRELHMWQSWNKPFYVRDSPFQQTLWIDSDCVVVGDLSSLGREVERGPFVVEHWVEPYVQPNHEDLYRRFPVSLRLPPGKGFNAGVIGLDIVRDAELLNLWCWLVTLAADDPEARSLVTWFDEGALHWALQAARRIDRLLPRGGWNRYMPSQSSDDPAAYVLAHTPLNDDVIWHFAGNTKPWRINSA
jgi:hypothetical protein